MFNVTETQGCSLLQHYLGYPDLYKGTDFTCMECQRKQEMYKVQYTNRGGAGQQSHHLNRAQRHLGSH